MKSIHVAVVVEGNESYGVANSLLLQQQFGQEFGMVFHYVCLGDGSFYRTLGKLGHNVHLIPMRCAGPFPPNVFTSAFALGKLLMQMSRIRKNLKEYLEKTRPHVIYTHRIPVYFIAGGIARSCHIKSIGHIRGTMNRTRNWGLSCRLVSFLLDRSLDGGIAISQAVRDSLWGRIRKKTICIYNGIDLQIIEQSLSDTKYSVLSTDIVCVGRLVPIKKQHILIEALHLLALRGLTPKLVFVGGPKEQDNQYYVDLQEKVNEYHLEEQVQFVGQVKNPHPIVASARMSVLCCDREGFGYVVVEAMACGTPVVVVDAGGPGEIVRHGENGLKFETDNAKQLADCLRKLLTENVLCLRIREKALQEVREKFSIQAHMTRLRDCFEQILEGRQR